MTLGIAIPTYIKHVNNLYSILETLSKSTVLPLQVSVSISSMQDDIILNNYPFELIISKTSQYKNPSQNRNIAGNKLTTDIISFIDGDDIPHVKRNEYLLDSFNNECEIIVHNYERINQYQNLNNHEIGNLELLKEYIDGYISDSHAPQSKIMHFDYHNAHISLLNNIFKKYQYDEDESIKYMEDSEFTSRLVKNGYKISYIKNKLSYYIK